VKLAATAAIAATVACSSPPGTAKPATTVGLDCGDRTCLEAARDHELGRGVPRDYAAAAALLEKGCDGGQGDPLACRRLATALTSARGVAMDRARGRALLESTCERGDAGSCALLAVFAEGDDPSLPGRLEEACAAGDLDACDFSFDLAVMSRHDCGDDCHEIMMAAGAPLCERGAVAPCTAVAWEVLHQCQDVGDDCAEVAARVDPRARAAFHRLGGLCDTGDPRACVHLTGRAIPMDELCRAADWGACYEAVHRGEAPRSSARVPCEDGAIAAACTTAGDDLRFAETDRTADARALYVRACELGDRAGCAKLQDPDLATGCDVVFAERIPASEQRRIDGMTSDRTTLVIREESAKLARLGAAEQAGVAVNRVGGEHAVNLSSADAVLLDAQGRIRARFELPYHDVPASLGRCVAALAAEL
jgi:hypothetical protein